MRDYYREKELTKITGDFDVRIFVEPNKNLVVKLSSGSFDKLVNMNRYQDGFNDGFAAGKAMIDDYVYNLGVLHGHDEHDK